MVGYKDTLYVFGGEVGFSNGIETPMWMYNINVSWILFLGVVHKWYQPNIGSIVINSA